MLLSKMGFQTDWAVKTPSLSQQCAMVERGLMLAII